MRKAILYVAMSLDGFLADETGGVDWIGDVNPSTEEEEEGVSSYELFYDRVDTIFMGRVTYEQITQEVSPDIWMYGGKKTYVFCQNEKPSLPDIEFTQRSPVELLRYLKHRKGKDIWVCGGAKLIASMMEADLIDEFHISVVPVLLGKGTSLFSAGYQGQRLELRSSQQVNGMAELIYEKIKL